MSGIEGKRGKGREDVHPLRIRPTKMTLKKL